MKKTLSSLSYDERNLLDEIQLAQNAMDSAYSNFEQATEPDLIDCYIYMINATSKRYKFLIERARSLNLKGIPDDDVLLDKAL
ncbi:MAG: YaaL family protein [Alistipes sp.]|nr:YaaL family protein [Alistipes sp.]